MPARMIVSNVLTKISKHLALLACFLIAGHASGRYEVDQFWLFALACTSALIHLAGRRLSLSPIFDMHLPRSSR